MIKLEDTEPALQEAVRQYRHYGHEVYDLDQKVSRFNRDEDVASLQEAVRQRNQWKAKIQELIKGRERDLSYLLIG